MKKVISFVLAFVMILSVGITAMAAGSPTGHGGGGGGRTGAGDGSGGLELYNDEDILINVVPWPEVQITSVGNAGRLSPEEKESFLATYEEMKKSEKPAKYFYWLDIPDSYKTEDLAYAKYPFSCAGKGVRLSCNGKEMEVENAIKYKYYAKLTEFGAVAIYVD